jgi:hypothetical protein
VADCSFSTVAKKKVVRMQRREIGDRRRWSSCPGQGFKERCKKTFGRLLLGRSEYGDIECWAVSKSPGDRVSNGCFDVLWHRAIRFCPDDRGRSSRALVGEAACKVEDATSDRAFVSAGKSFSIDNKDERIGPLYCPPCAFGGGVVRLTAHRLNHSPGASVKSTSSRRPSLRRKARWRRPGFGPS